MVACGILVFIEELLLREFGMSNGTLEQIRTQALALSESDRAELARDLLKSLDGPPDPDANNAWDAEIERRLKQIDEGTVQPMDREELRRRIRQYSESR